MKKLVINTIIVFVRCFRINPVSEGGKIVQHYLYESKQIESGQADPVRAVRLIAGPAPSIKSNKLVLVANVSIDFHLL